ncbi:hypothetical protein RhiirC2_800702 [Rhizophagus irregularis]|uniref:Uncharacterized protein n=1 Tax=Rhizophagus irregularis TaxID=588596 RepID=A0A2N1M3A8_9GLOM|nr:hypothetical protein RhiirC2_800702 [Rhizophagus irregularis]
MLTDLERKISAASWLFDMMMLILRLFGRVGIRWGWILTKCFTNVSFFLVGPAFMVQDSVSLHFEVDYHFQRKGIILKIVLFFSF